MGDLSSAGGQHHAHPRQGEVAVAAGDLHPRPSCALRRGGEADLGQQFSGIERSRQIRHEQVARGDHPGPLGAPRGHLAIQRHQDRGQLRGRVGVGDAAADRAAVADLRVAHEPERVPKQRAALGHLRRAFRGALPGEGADAQRAPVVPDVGQRFDPVDVDEIRRPGQPHVHQGDEALPARQHLGVVAVLGEESRPLIDGPGTVVLERRGLHALPPRRSSRHLKNCPISIFPTPPSMRCPTPAISPPT